MSYIINQEFSPLDNNIANYPDALQCLPFSHQMNSIFYNAKHSYTLINICTYHVNKDIGQITVHFAWIHFKISITVLVQFFSKSPTN